VKWDIVAGWAGAGGPRDAMAPGTHQSRSAGWSADLLEPYWTYRNAALSAGRLPRNPYLFLGVPFLANPQAAVLYPLHWPLTWIEADRALVWSALLHVWLAAGFTIHSPAPSGNPSCCLAIRAACSGWAVHAGRIEISIAQHPGLAAGNAGCTTNGALVEQVVRRAPG
jgi:hypothetical protein